MPVRGIINILIKKILSEPQSNPGTVFVRNLIDKSYPLFYFPFHDACTSVLSIFIGLVNYSTI